jgi:hypothetical protein
VKSGLLDALLSYIKFHKFSVFYLAIFTVLKLEQELKRNKRKRNKEKKRETDWTAQPATCPRPAQFPQILRREATSSAATFFFVTCEPSIFIYVWT